MNGTAPREEGGARVDGSFTRFRIFKNRHGELRVGWRILLFVLVTALLTAALVRPVAVLFPGVDETVLSMMLVLALLLATWIMTRFVNKKPFGAAGLGLHHRTAGEFSLGCFLGFLMMTGIFLIEYGLGYLSFSSLDLPPGTMASRMAVSALAFLLGAAGEELMFRGYFFQTLMQGITFLPAALVMSLLFGVAHLSNPNATLFAAVNVALAGLWLSFAYLKTRSLWFPIGLHASWNFCQTTLYAFPTSGLDFQEKTVYATTVSGPDWITGGAFGPEGGILATLALIFCTWFIVKSSLISRPEGVVTLDSIEDLVPPVVAKEQ